MLAAIAAQAERHSGFLQVERAQFVCAYAAPLPAVCTLYILCTAAALLPPMFSDVTVAVQHYCSRCMRLRQRGFKRQLTLPELRAALQSHQCTGAHYSCREVLAAAARSKVASLALQHIPRARRAANPSRRQGSIGDADTQQRAGRHAQHAGKQPRSAGEANAAAVNVGAANGAAVKSAAHACPAAGADAFPELVHNDSKDFIAADVLRSLRHAGGKQVCTLAWETAAAWCKIGRTRSPVYVLTRE
jgi:hypothetical protein